MTSWEQMQWLISQAKRNGYWSSFAPFKDGDKVGHNSHYRFIWLPSWWKALFGDEWHEWQHKALDFANEFGPNSLINYIWESKKEYDAQKKNKTEDKEPDGDSGQE